MNKNYYIITKNGRVDRLPEGKSVVALGTFDGVHTAHKKILYEAVALKERLGADFAGAWCFCQLPVNVLSDKKIPMLSSVDDKIERILACGLDFVAIGNFNALSSVSAKEFTDNILSEQLSCVGAVCGFNHRFGKKGLGSPEFLKERFGSDAVAVVDEVTMFGETVSSSAIRNHIAEGRLDVALRMLDQPFCISARIIGGKRLGRTIGFPTANQLLPEDIITPKHGIYATLCYTEDGRRFIGVSNVGIRPTITDGTDNHVVNCETFICNFNENIYGKLLRVCFCHYLREEKRFDSLDELCAQISKDARNAIRIFAEENIKP